MKNCNCKQPVFDLMTGTCKTCGNSIIHLGKRISTADNYKPKQETLEEAANKAYCFYGDVELREAFELGAKWQQERMYSEEEVIELLKTFDKNFNSGIVERNKGIKKWFEQFKKK